MIYKRISYADFAPYRISKIKGSEIKIIEWERQKKEILQNFGQRNLTL